MNAPTSPRPRGTPSLSPEARDAAAAADLPDEDAALLQEAADRIVAARMAVPAMMMLESVAPMNFVSASMLRLVSPAWQALMPRSRIDRVAAILERRAAVPALIRMIDAAEDARRRGPASAGPPTSPGSDT